MKFYETKGPAAARLRQRKRALLQQFHLPGGALPGSLVMSYRKCGKPTCHCASSDTPHPIWELTFWADGQKRVKVIPKQWVDELLPVVEQGREYKDAVVELFAINAKLLVLWLEQNKKPRRRAQTRVSTRPVTEDERAA